jgi:hypothetical protein
MTSFQCKTARVVKATGTDPFVQPR